jgi:hypothetical protein
LISADFSGLFGTRSSKTLASKSKKSPAPPVSAGTAFREYWTHRGTRTGVLPDFFIGAHAAVDGIGPLSCAARRDRSYYPTITRGEAC